MTKSRTYWGVAPHRAAAGGGSLFSVEVFVSNGSDSNIGHDCYFCKERIGYGAARVEAMDTVQGEAWTLVHEAC